MRISDWSSDVCSSDLQVSSDLQGLRSMVAASSDLRRLLSSPVITREEQRRAMAAVLDKAGIGAITRNFVLVVAQNHRLFALPAMSEAYLAALAPRRGEEIGRAAGRERVGREGQIAGGAGA